MKNLFIIFVILGLSLSAHASCVDNDFTEKSPLVKKLNDFMGDCFGAIEKVMDEEKCTSEDIKEIKNFYLSGNASEFKQGHSSFCLLEVKGGVFQVMMSSMSVPPIAVVLFSRWD